MLSRVTASIAVLLTAALAVPGKSTAQGIDGVRALRRLDECLNPKHISACQYDYFQPCLEALRAGLSAERAADAHYAMALRHLAMAESPDACGFCTNHVFRANCEIKGIQEDAALLALQEALRRRPTHQAARSSLVLFFMDRKNLIEAYRLAKEGVSLQPGEAYSHYLLSSVCIRLGRWDEALDTSRRAAEIKPSAYLDSLGDLATSLGLFGEALDAYQAALRLAPDQARLHASLAVLQEKRGDTAAAEKEFARVLQLSPEFFQKPYNRRYAESYERILTQPTGKGPAAEPAREAASGSGFFVTQSGHLITNAHVVAGAYRILARTANGRFLAAELLALDQSRDLALLKVEGQHSALPLSREVPRRGAAVAVAGFPNPDMQGLSIKITRGEINSLTGARDDPRLLQISAQVQPGNSGGPLIDMKGNVSGVVVARLDDAMAFEASGSLPQNVNYAVKASYLVEFLAANAEVNNLLLVPASRALSMEDVADKAEKATVLIVAERQ